MAYPIQHTQTHSSIAATFPKVDIDQATWPVCTYTHTCVYMFVVYICVCTYMCTCMEICIDIYVYVNKCVYTCVHVCEFMCVCIFICIYVLHVYNIYACQYMMCVVYIHRTYTYMAFVRQLEPSID